MDRNVVHNRISQLPLALFGIIHDVKAHGISLSFYNQTNTIQLNCEMTLLP
ncbi:RAxF-45 family protein [Paenibacillus sp. KN14-4R]|uniref:RAxF-45 family protein n=1 Tax=Paenibacillus sp. KN14-4R TaxID=3445773 RepID=UPI003FA0AA54